jgi:hypothetical protein
LCWRNLLDDTINEQRTEFSSSSFTLLFKYYDSFFTLLEGTLHYQLDPDNKVDVTTPRSCLPLSSNSVSVCV